MLSAMSDDKKEFPRDFMGAPPPKEEKKADPLDDVREGLGLLFRAAKSTIDKLPTKDIEKGVQESVQEVGKAIGRVVEALGKELSPKKDSAPPAPSPEPSAQVRVADDKKSDDAK